MYGLFTSAFMDRPIRDKLTIIGSLNINYELMNEWKEISMSCREDRDRRKIRRLGFLSLLKKVNDDQQVVEIRFPAIVARLQREIHPLE